MIYFSQVTVNLPIVIVCYDDSLITFDIANFIMCVQVCCKGQCRGERGPKTVEAGAGKTGSGKEMAKKSSNSFCPGDFSGAAHHTCPHVSRVTLLPPCQGCERCRACVTAS